MATVTLKVKKVYQGVKLISMAPDDILRSHEVKRSVCARNWTLFTTLLPVIQSLREMVWSDVQFANESFFWTGSFWRISSTKSDWTSETVHGSSSTDLQVTQSSAFQVKVKVKALLSILPHVQHTQRIEIVLLSDPWCIQITQTLTVECKNTNKYWLKYNIQLYK